MSQLVPVQFCRSWLKYNVGETAGFPASEAKELVEREVARYIPRAAPPQAPRAIASHGVTTPVPPVVGQQPTTAEQTQPRKSTPRKRRSPKRRIS